MCIVFRGFEVPNEKSSAQLLVWHDRVSYFGAVMETRLHLSRIPRPCYENNI